MDSSSSVPWQDKLGSVDHIFVHQFDMDLFTTQRHQSFIKAEENQHSESNSSSHPMMPQTDPTRTASARPLNPETLSPMLISFSNSKLSASHKPDVLVPQGGAQTRKGGYKGESRSSKPPFELQDHVLAERKRREKLSQRFIALLAIVPGLKKMDKSSVLGGAAKYIKQLEEQVKTFEEQTAEKPSESVVMIKKSGLVGDYRPEDQLPEIEARVCDKNVLLRIHSEKQNGVLVRTMSEIEKLNLTVISTSVVPFGRSALDITVIAQMEDEVSEAKDLARTLHFAFQRAT